VALELLELLARSHIPQSDRPVVRPTDKQGGIRRIETDAIDAIAVALERLQALALFWVPQNDLGVIPAAREKLAVKTPCDCIDTITMSGESPLALAVCDAPQPYCFAPEPLGLTGRR